MRLGEHTKSTQRDCVFNKGKELYCADPIQEIRVTPSDFIIHKDFNYINFKDDIALIRLPVLARTNQNNIKTICLPFKPDPIIPTLTVIGFGRTERSLQTSDVLRKVHLELMKNEECVKLLPLTPASKLDHKQICGGGNFF